MSTATRSRKFSTVEELATRTTPEPHAFEMTDRSCRGLRLRVLKSGRCEWVFAYRSVDKKVRRIQLGAYPTTGTVKQRRASLDATRAQAFTLSSEVMNPDQPDPHERIAEQQAETVAKTAEAAQEQVEDEWTLSRLGQLYVEVMAEAGRRPRTVSEVERQFRSYVYPTLGDVPATDVTSEDLEATLEPLLAAGKSRQYNMCRTTLVSLYSWASGARKRRLPGAAPPPHLKHWRNPALDLQIAEERKTRQRRAYTPDELRVLWSLLQERRGETHTDALMLMALCGTRVSETCAAGWLEMDLDGEHSTWTIPGERTKNHKAHTVYLSPPAVEMLQRRERKTGYVFRVRGNATGHSRPDSARDKLKLLLRLGGLEGGLTAHELRHSVETFVRASGFSPDVRRRLLNHTGDDKLADIYEHHSFDDEARAVWLSWGEHLDALAEGREATVLPLKQGLGA